MNTAAIDKLTARMRSGDASLSNAQLWMLSAQGATLIQALMALEKAARQLEEEPHLSARRGRLAEMGAALDHLDALYPDKP